MSVEPHAYHWIPGVHVPGDAPDGALAGRLEGPLADRRATARALVLEASGLIERWLLEREQRWAEPEQSRAIVLELRQALDGLRAVHGWRAPIARWVQALEQVLGGMALEGRPRLEALCEELGLWQGGYQGEAAAASATWIGAALAPGCRLPDRSGCAAHIAAGPLPGLLPGEVIVTLGCSETVALALDATYERGLAPRVVVGEGVPDLAGRRLAAGLSERGLAVRLTYDAALASELGAADRLWLGSEALGLLACEGRAPQYGFLARAGTRLLLEECRRLDIPTALFATSDKWMPRVACGEALPEAAIGVLKQPAWSARDEWMLWEDAPEGVELALDTHEPVPLDLVDVLVDEQRACATPVPSSVAAARTSAAFPAAS